MAQRMPSNEARGTDEDVVVNHIQLRRRRRQRRALIKDPESG